MPITKKRLHGIKKKNNQSHKKKSMSGRDKRQHTRKNRKSIHLRNKSLKGGDQKRKKAAAARKQKAKVGKQQLKRQKKIQAKKQAKTPSTLVSRQPLSLPAPSKSLSLEKPISTTKPIVSSNKLEKSIVPVQAKDVKLVTRPQIISKAEPKDEQKLKNFCNTFSCNNSEQAVKCYRRNLLKGPYRHPDKGGNIDEYKK